jgi:hypothetical protein
MFVSHYQILNQLVDIYEIQKSGYAIDDDLKAIIFNPVATAIQKWGPFKLLRWLQNFHQSTWNHEALYAGRS